MAIVDVFKYIVFFSFGDPILLEWLVDDAGFEKKAKQRDGHEIVDYGYSNAVTRN